MSPKIIDTIKSEIQTRFLYGSKPGYFAFFDTNGIYHTYYSCKESAVARTARPEYTLSFVFDIKYCNPNQTILEYLNKIEELLGIHKSNFILHNLPNRNTCSLICPREDSFWFKSLFYTDLLLIILRSYTDERNRFEFKDLDEWITKFKSPYLTTYGKKYLKNITQLKEWANHEDFETNKEYGKLLYSYTQTGWYINGTKSFLAHKPNWAKNIWDNLDKLSLKTPKSPEERREARNARRRELYKLKKKKIEMLETVNN